MGPRVGRSPHEAQHIQAQQPAPAVEKLETTVPVAQATPARAQLPGDGVESKPKAPPPPAPASVAHGQKAFGTGSPMMARFAKDVPKRSKRYGAPPGLQTIHEGLEIDDPRNALREAAADLPAANPKEEAGKLPKVAMELSEALGVVRGLGFASAAGTKMAKSSSTAVYQAGDAAAAFAGGVAGSAGHGIMGLGNTVSALQMHKYAGQLEHLRSCVLASKARAEKAAARGEPGAAERVDRMDRAKEVFDHLIHEAKHERNSQAITGAVNFGAAAAQGIYVGGAKAAATFTTPIGLGIVAVDEARHAIHNFEDAHAVGKRQQHLKDSVSGAVADMNSIVDQHNAKLKEQHENPVLLKPMTEEHLAKPAQGYVGKESSRLHHRKKRGIIRGVGDATTSVGATTAAASTIAGAGPGVAAGFGLMATGAGVKGATELIHALGKTKREAKREEIYNGLKQVLREGSPEDRMSTAKVIEKYASRLPGKLTADDLYREPEQSIDLLKSLHKAAVEKAPHSDSGKPG